MGRTILVVDDSRASRFMICSVLTREGYEVIEAVDGADALTKLEASVIDLIITDLTMPNMDGIELIRKVRSNTTHKFLPIITLTSDVQPRRKDEARAAGTTAWLAKPFEPQEMLKAITRILG